MLPAVPRMSARDGRSQRAHRSRAPKRALVSTLGAPAQACESALQAWRACSTSLRALVLGALLVGGAGCDADQDPPDRAQTREFALDSGVVPSDAHVPIVKLTNVGTACEHLEHVCEGPLAQCMEISLSGAFYQNGYCTADCRNSAECGPGGECPVGESQRVAPSYPFRSTWARKCFKSCDPAAVGSCRAGYACMSLAEAYLADDAPAPLHRNVCIPRLTSLNWDAGF